MKPPPFLLTSYLPKITKEKYKIWNKNRNENLNYLTINQDLRYGKGGHNKIHNNFQNRLYLAYNNYG